MGRQGKEESFSTFLWVIDFHRENAEKSEKISKLLESVCEKVSKKKGMINFVHGEKFSNYLLVQERFFFSVVIKRDEGEKRESGKK